MTEFQQLDLGFDECTHRLFYYAGYTFSMPLGEQSEWCSGVVTTPRYIDRCLRECDLPVVIDNGAFPAWRNGTPLTLEKQLDGIFECADKAGDRVIHVIAPDVIGNARATWSRICASLDELREFWPRLLLPMQEGVDTARMVDLALGIGAGLFVGGATKLWKRRQVERVRAVSEDVFLHVGRISKKSELSHAAWCGVDSFDTTTFLRQQTINKAIEWRPRFEKFVKKA